MVVDFRLLGDVVMLVDGRAVEIGHARQRCVLVALLVDANRAVPADWVIDRVWADQAPQRARATLRGYLSRLRQILASAEDVRIVHQPGGYLLSVDPAAPDVHRFHRLVADARTCEEPQKAVDLYEQALGLWRGEAFATLDTPWLNSVRASLDTARFAAELDRNDAALAAGLHAALLADVSASATAHPLDERLAAQLMLALYRCGRQSEALAHFQQVRGRLVEELGIDPGPPLQRLHQQLLAADPAAAAPVQLEDPQLSLRSSATRGAVKEREAPEALASMVRSLRGRVLWTQEVLAQRSGVSVGTIAGIESGRVRRPRRATLRMLADALDLTEQQRTALARAAGDGAAGSAAAGVVPAQLPNAVAGFVGRSEFLRHLDDLAGGDQQPSAVVISAVSGTAGVGKTALAVHWAHHICDRFPDGQLYVNLRGFDPSGQVTDPAEAIHGFLDALGIPPQQIPDDLDAQAALYRSQVNGKRILVVLDNARDTDQIRSLLPGSPGCLVVVTSRNTLTGLITEAGAHPVMLDLLTTDEARQLLARRLGHDRVAAEPDAVADIIQRCARLPLALAVVAARAATHPHFSLQTLAAELRDIRLDAFADRDQHVDVRAVFSLSYQQLSPTAQRLFRLLGLHPGPDISAPAVASLTGASPIHTPPLLLELTRSHLLVEHQPGRYTCHDLLRSYATELTEGTDTDDTRREAIGRILDHYLHTAHAANGLLTPATDPIALRLPRPGVTPEHLNDHHQAMAWFVGERHALLACLDLAAATGFDTHTWQLAWTLHTFLYRQGHWRDRATAWTLALDATRRLGDQAAQAIARDGLGTAELRLGRFDDARTHFHQALALYGELGDQTGQADIHRALSRMCKEEHQHVDALDHDYQALALYQQAGHQNGQVKVLNSIGWCHALLGQYQQALGPITQALGLFQELGDRGGEAATWHSLGYAHHHLGHHHTAIDSYQHARILFRDLGDRYHEAVTLNHLGETFHSTGNSAAARESWQQALAILDELGHTDADGVRTRLERIERAAPNHP